MSLGFESNRAENAGLFVNDTMSVLVQVSLAPILSSGTLLTTTVNECICKYVRSACIGKSSIAKSSLFH